MNFEDLHTYTLEKQFGTIKNCIVKQDKNIRIVPLQDNLGISRTLGVVKFSNMMKTYFYHI